jgi:hypothetical protein
MIHVPSTLGKVSSGENEVFANGQGLRNRNSEKWQLDRELSDELASHIAMETSLRMQVGNHPKPVG